LKWSATALAGGPDKIPYSGTSVQDTLYIRGMYNFFPPPHCSGILSDYNCSTDRVSYLDEMLSKKPHLVWPLELNAAARDRTHLNACEYYIALLITINTNLNFIVFR